MQRLLGVTMVLGTAGVAIGQPALDPITGVPDPTAAPAMVTMDRFDSQSRAGGEFRFPLLKGNGGPNRTALVLDLHGHYIDPGSNFGGYAQVPVSLLNTGETPGTDGDTSLGIGDLEVGGLYLLKGVGRTDIGLVTRFGLTAPTAAKDGGAARANITGAPTRLTDIILGVPRGLSVRLGVSPTLRNGRIFARADLGVDINIDRATAPPDDGFGEDRLDPVIRFNLGGGYDGGSFAVMGELVNIFFTDGTDGAPASINTLALSARFQAGSMQPYVALTFPMDEESRNTFDVVLTGGLELPLAR